MINSKSINSVHYFLLLVMLMGCVTRQADLTAYYPSEGQARSVALVRDIEYDNHGRPGFNNILKERPHAEGEQFTLAHLVNDKPVRSFDIVVVPERADATRPFKVIYEWTGKGFKTGVAAGKTFTDSAMRDKRTDPGGSGMLTGAESVMAVGQVFILSVGGFIVGLAASVPATMQELSRVVVASREKVISYSVYEYDGKQRLGRVKTYLPTDISREIIKTDFFYRNNEATPMKTEVTSYPENTVRTIP